MSDEELNKIIMQSEDNYEKLKDKLHDQYIEIDRLNNIINELERFINMALEIYDNVDLKTLRLVKDKIKELKEK